MSSRPETEGLRRRLGLFHLVLYGLGVTIGAGIYVLIGLTAAEAGLYAPVSFAVAAGVVLFTGLTYAELSTRFPVSAGEAIFVEKGLRRPQLALLVGLLVAASGIVSSATIAIGAASYLFHLIPIEPNILTAGLIIFLGLIAAWGILESVTIAAFLTVVEIFGLFLVITFAFKADPMLIERAGELVPPFETSAWSGILSGALLAFFAFIGFEDLANVAEEAKQPKRTMPRAILLTLGLSSLLYLVVVSVVVLSVPMEALTSSASPLLLVFETASPATLLSFNFIAGLATINGILIQMIMSSRVLYGLSKNHHLPPALGKVSPITGTPIIATVVVVAIVLVLALALPVGQLAEWTSRFALLVFALVNAALIGLKRQKTPLNSEGFVVPLWIPVIGFLTCAILLIFSLATLI